MKALLSSSLALILATFFATPAFASTPQTFKLDQTDFLLQTSAGKTLSENIVVQNSTDQKQTLSVSFEGYKLPTTQVLDHSYLTKHNIDFATLPLQQIDMEPLASASIPIILKPLDTFPSGDYYGTLILKSNEETQKVNFTVRILGQIKENLEIKEIKNSGNYLVLKIANTGNISEEFSLKTTINRLLGGDISLTSPRATIRSGEIIDVKFDHGQLLPGFFQTQTTLQYGAKATSVTKLYSFWENLELFIVSFFTLVASFLLYFVFRRKKV